jgi:hypothetical protein
MSEQANVLSAQAVAAQHQADLAKAAEEKRIADAKVAEDKRQADIKAGKVPAPPVESVPGRKPVIPMRARFVVTDINTTTRGATELFLSATYDGDILPKNRLVPGNNPKGELSIEVDPAWAAANVSHGSVFYLVTA